MNDLFGMVMAHAMADELEKIGKSESEAEKRWAREARKTTLLQGLGGAAGGLGGGLAAALGLSALEVLMGGRGRTGATLGLLAGAPVGGYLGAYKVLKARQERLSKK